MADDPSIVARIAATLDDASLAAFKSRIESALSGLDMSKLSNTTAIENALARLEILQRNYTTAIGKTQDAFDKLQTAEAANATASTAQTERAVKAAETALQRRIEAQNRAATAISDQENRIVRIVEQGVERTITSSARAAQAEIDAAEKAATAKANAVAKAAAASQAATEKEIANAEKKAKAEQDAADKAASGWTRALQSLSQGNLGGVAGGISQALGIDAATLGIGALIAAIGAVGTASANAYLQAYNSGQENLRQIALMRRETGLAAEEATKLQAALAFTQNPNSPFAVINFAQIAGNLQNVVDAQNGLIKLTPQIENFAYGLEKLGIDARDSSGNVKLVTTVLLEMSRALENMPSPQKAQILQDIGGIFGKDVAAVVNVNPQLLQQTFDQALKVSQQQLDFADRRTQAVQAAVQAEQQFNIALTQALGPLDLIAQKIKRDILGALTGAVRGEGGLNNDIMRVLLGVALGPTTAAFLMRPPGGTESGQSMSWADFRRQESPEPVTQNTAEIESNKSRIKANDDFKASLGLVTNQLNLYKDAVKAAEDAEKTRIQNNVGMVKGFDQTLTGVISSSKGYDSYYKQVHQTEDEIKKLQDLSQMTVSYRTLNGKPLQGSESDVERYVKLLAGQEKEQALDAAYKEKAEAQIAAANAPRTTVSAKGKVSTRPAQGLSATQALRLEYVSGEDPVEKVNDYYQQKAINDAAAKIGLEPGQVVTTESLGTAYRKRGLSKDESERLANLYTQLKELDLSDKESQFKTMQGAMDRYAESMAKGGDATKAVKDALAESGTQLQTFADKAGLFQSVGFTRAIAEASLEAKLSSGGFGTGKEALEKYAEAAKNLYGVMGTLRDALAGVKPLDLGSAVGAGLLPEGTVPEGLTPENLTIDKEGKVVAKWGNWQTTKLLEDATKPKALSAGRRGRVFNPEQEYATPEELSGQAQQASDVDFALRVLTGQVGAQETADRMYKKLGIDPKKGIEQIMHMTVKMNEEDPIDYSKRVATEFDKLNEMAINIRLLINSKDPEEILRQLQDLRTRASDPSFDARDIPIPGSQGTHPVGVGLPNLQGPTNPLAPTFGVGRTSVAGPALPAVQVPVYVDNSPKSQETAWADFRKLEGTVQGVADSEPVQMKSEVDQSDAAKLNLQADALSIRNMLTAWFVKNPVIIKTVMSAAPPGASDPFGNNNNPAGPAGAPPPPNTTPPPSGLPDIFKQFMPDRDIGGDVAAGRPYYIGPREIFVPGMDGTVLGPTLTNRLREKPYGIGHWSTSNSNTINIDARGSAAPRETVRQVEAAASAYFISEDPGMRARLERRRRGL